MRWEWSPTTWASPLTPAATTSRPFFPNSARTRAVKPWPRLTSEGSCAQSPMSRPSEADVGAKPEKFPGKAERFPVRAAVAKFLVMGFLALLIVATPVAFWIRAEAERHALDNALLF